MIDKLLIVSLGLMGGSLAAAIKKRHYAKQILAWGRREASLQQGLELGIIDSYDLDLEHAAADADLIVVCSPTQVAESLLVRVIEAAPSSAVITDVASVKGNLAAALINHFGEMPANVVLGHPIAGAERSGVLASNADLYVNHRVILTPDQNSSTQAIATVTGLWQACEAEVVSMPVADHDQILAGTSHLPHVLAYNMIGALAKLPSRHDVFKFAAGGLRDFTRIAASDPQMWTEIALSNKAAILELLALYKQELSQLTQFIETDDTAGLMQSFQEAKASRDYFSELLEQQHS